jgi:CMP-N,N'-diacetyllegionaminic acid synthase
VQALKAIAIIPARGGSKRLPRKNLRPLCGVPLIAWSIRAAREAKLLSEVYVSTDDLEIATEAHKYGAEVVMRPPEISGDESRIEDALRHVLLSGIERPDVVVTLQPTSPVRPEGLVDRCISALRDSPDLKSTLTVRPAGVTWWQEYMESGRLRFRWTNQFRTALIPQSQAWDITQERFSEDGSVFACRTECVLVGSDRRGAPVLPIVNDWSPDIDEESDLRLAETLLRAREEVPA